MIPPESYAAGLVENVRLGLFDAMPYGPRLRQLADEMVWRRATIGAHRIKDEFGGMRQLNAAFETYQQEANGGLLIDHHPVCIEDEVSAVLLGNHPRIERAVDVVDYRAHLGSSFALYAGCLRLAHAGPKDIGFQVLEFHVAILWGERVEAIEDPFIKTLAAKDLVQSTLTALEQLTYDQMFRAN